MQDNASHPDQRKRPWYPWVHLAVGLLQLLLFWWNLRESLAAAETLSGAAWVAYAAKQKLACALNGMAAACFLGSFLISMLCMRQKGKEQRAAGVFLLLLGIVWGAVCIWLHLFSWSPSGALCWFLLIVAFGGAAYEFWAVRKTAPRT